MRAAAVVSGVLVLVLGACKEDPKPAELTPAFDLGAVIRQVHFAWREDADAWSSAHSTWSARVDAEGLAFTPFHLASSDATPARGTAVRFGSALIRRGARALGDPGRWAGGRPGALWLDRQTFSEELETGEAGVEQRWRFPARPAGTGALEVRVPVNAAFVGSTAGGLHFQSAGLMVRYGHATWVDAAGRKTQVPAQYQAGDIVMQVPGALVDGSVFPAVLDPVIGPETGLDQPALGLATASQINPSVASNGTDFLVVWADNREGTLDIFGARVSAAGVLLDPGGIAIAIAPGPQRVPDVAWGGGVYLVTWADNRTGSEIYATRVNSAGTVLNPLSLLISSAANTRDNPAIDFDGTNFFIVWADARLGTLRTYGARVAPTGSVIDPSGLLVGSSGAAYAPDVAFNGTVHLVTWHDLANVNGNRVSPNGAVLDNLGFTIGGTVEQDTEPAVASDGTNFFVTWRSGGQGETIAGARVSGTGVVLDPTPVAISTGTTFKMTPTIAWTGTHFFIAWFAGGNLEAARVAPSGVLTDVTPIAVSSAATYEFDPVIAWSSTGGFLVWANSGTGSLALGDLFGARLTSAGAVLDAPGVLITSGPNTQQTPKLAWDGTNYLAVWADYRSRTSWDLYGTRISPAGVALDPGGILISAAANDQTAPAVTWAGSSYLVVWVDRRNPTLILYGARVSAAGVVLDPTGFPITGSELGGAVSVAWGGSNSLVVWEGAVGGFRNIRGARVNAAGVVLDSSPIVISSTSTFDRMPVVAADVGNTGNNFLVVWSDMRNAGNGWDLYGGRYNSAGNFLDFGGVPLVQGVGDQLEPAIAFGGGQYLVAWKGRGSDGWNDVRATRVNPTGTLTVLDPGGFPVVSALLEQELPAVEWTGRQFLVSWLDSRGGAARDVYAGRVTSQGTRIDGDGLRQSNSSRNELSSALACGSLRRCLLAWSRYDDRPGVTTERGFVSPFFDDEAPVASAGSVTTPEDSPVVVSLQATDADGDALTFVVLTQPSSGTLSGVAPNLTYTPGPNFHGADSFTFRANDGLLDSPVATFSLVVTPVNDAPVATAQAATTAEDTSRAVTLAGTDVDGDGLTFIVGQPTHGTLSGTAPNLTYVPALNYFGPDAFTFQVNDGTVSSASATVSLTVTAVNDAPVATAQASTTAEDTLVSITLGGTDVEGSALTFTVLTQPAHGTFTGTAPNLSFTPAANYFGPDSFTFRVNDGALDSPAATVSITITPVNDLPVALAAALTTAEDQPVQLTLAGQDVEGASLTYTVVTGPGSGTLSGTAPNLTYTPALNFVGADQLSFRVSDGALDSLAATVSITVTGINDPPSATAQTLTTAEDTALPVTLAGADVEGDALSFTIATPPLHGTLSGTAPNLSYLPAADYAGGDSFTFTANDGTTSSVAATVTLTVTPVNDAPVATGQTVTTAQDSPVAITLTGLDADGDSLTFAVVTQPARGTLSGSAPALTFTPAAGTSGTETFTFAVADGSATSAEATVSIVVTPQGMTGGGGGSTGGGGGGSTGGGGGGSTGGGGGGSTGGGGGGSTGGGGGGSTGGGGGDSTGGGGGDSMGGGDGATGGGAGEIDGGAGETGGGTGGGGDAPPAGGCGCQSTTGMEPLAALLAFLFFRARRPRGVCASKG